MIYFQKRNRILDDDFVVKKICETTVVIPINSRLVEGYDPIVLNDDAGSIVESLTEEMMGVILY